MDADDKRRAIINEQLNLLRNNQQNLQHVIKNQLKVLKGTIGHMDSLERTLNYNENLLVNVTEGMKSQLAKFYRQENINERLLVLTTITIDLIDTENILDFLVYTKEGVIMTRLIPIEKNRSRIKKSSSAINQRAALPVKYSWKTGAQYRNI